MASAWCYLKTLCKLFKEIEKGRKMLQRDGPSHAQNNLGRV